MYKLSIEPQFNPMVSTTVGNARTIFIHAIDTVTGAAVKEDGTIIISSNCDAVKLSTTPDGSDASNKLELSLRDIAWEIFLIKDSSYVYNTPFKIEGVLNTPSANVFAELQTFFINEHTTAADMEFGIVAILQPGKVVLKGRLTEIILSAIRMDVAATKNLICLRLTGSAGGHFITIDENNQEIDHGNIYNREFHDDLYLLSGLYVKFENIGAGMLTLEFKPESPVINKPMIMQVYGCKENDNVHEKTISSIINEIFNNN